MDSQRAGQSKRSLQELEQASSHLRQDKVLLTPVSMPTSSASRGFWMDQVCPRISHPGLSSDNRWPWLSVRSAQPISPDPNQLQTRSQTQHKHGSPGYLREGGSQQSRAWPSASCLPGIEGPEQLDVSLMNPILPTMFLVPPSSLAVGLIP